MTPAARAAAAITILDRILAGEAAEPALIRWARGNRYAGSGDRAAVRDLVYDSLRRLKSRAALGGELTGRGLMLGMCRETGIDPASLFHGEGYAPPPLSAAELAAGRPADATEALDLPDWLLPLWQASLEDDAAAVALAMRDRAPVWLRANESLQPVATIIATLADEGIEVTPFVDLPTALQVVKGERRISGSQAYQSGLVELQDLSAQLASALLPVSGSVLDYCAGGGGKALALAARGAQSVTAHDIDARRMVDLPQRAKRARANIRVASPGLVTGKFDLVVVDAPCSGSGTWRRTPDAKWRLTREDLEQVIRTQSDILDKTVGFVKVGGYLAYMTCSILRDENERQVEAFIKEHPDFGLVLQRNYSPLNASDGFHLSLLRHR